MGGMTMNNRTKADRVFYAILFLVAVGFAGVASPGKAWSGYYNSRDSLAEFDAFMRDHPKASTDLRNNPRLVYDGKWLRNHPEVDHFLKGRPHLREAIVYRRGSVFRSRERYDYRYDRRPDYRVDPRDRRWDWNHR
jgi:hypothetical protein